MTETAVDLNFVVGGAGPYVTMVHSLAADLSLFDAQARLLEKRFTVLRLDIRGHGKSPVPPAPYSMTGLADDVQRLFDRLGISQTAWVGVSLGGMIGLTHAIQRPGIITRLVLSDTTAGYPPAAHAGWRDRIGAARTGGMPGIVRGTLSRWFTPGFPSREPAVAGHYADIIVRTPAEGFAGCCEAIIGYDVSGDLEKVRCPTLIMVGQEDQATPPAMAETLAAGIPGARLHLIPDAAHQASVEQQAMFDAELEAFLQDHA